MAFEKRVGYGIEGKKGKLTISRRYNLRTLAAIKPWGIPRELAV